MAHITMPTEERFNFSKSENNDKQSTKPALRGSVRLKHGTALINKENKNERTT